LQAEATLRSLFLHCRDIDATDVKVLYTTSNYEHQYRALHESCGYAEFVHERDFRNDVLALLARRAYVLFLVDDLLFTHDFSFSEVLGQLDDGRVMNFQLHTGRNTTYCYPLKCQLTGYEFTRATRKISTYDWTRTNVRYPFDVSAAAYTLEWLGPLLNRTAFENPSTLELNANGEAEREIARPLIAVYDTSVSFVNPVNIAQTLYPANRAGETHAYSVRELAGKFQAGLRIRVEAYSGIQTTSAHHEAPLFFEESPGRFPRPS